MDVLWTAEYPFSANAGSSVPFRVRVLIAYNFNHTLNSTILVAQPQPYSILTTVYLPSLLYDHHNHKRQTIPYLPRTGTAESQNSRRSHLVIGLLGRLLTKFWNLAVGICSHSHTRPQVRSATGATMSSWTWFCARGYWHIETRSSPNCWHKQTIVLRYDYILENVSIEIKRSCSNNENQLQP